MPKTTMEFCDGKYRHIDKKGFDAQTNCKGDAAEIKRVFTLKQYCSVLQNCQG